MDSSFLEAKLGGNPSFVWRSLWATQETLKTWGRLRVDNGDGIIFGLTIGLFSQIMCG